MKYEIQSHQVIILRLVALSFERSHQVNEGERNFRPTMPQDGAKKGHS
jgi:hypothetical protein